MTELPGENWRIQTLWNELLTDELPPQPREYIRASELGKPYLDRWYTMRGEPITNPFTPRVKRVFDCGNIFEVLVVERIFRMLGILRETQAEVKVELPGCLPVIGHHDPRVGGKIDKEAARVAIAADGIPKWMQERALALMEALANQYPNGMREIITEIKTVNSRAFWAHSNVDPATGFFAGYDHHKLQLFTYLYGTNMPEGRIFYISKDDLTLMETPVFLDTAHLKEDWMRDISQMTTYYKSSTPPPREPDIVFNDEKGVYEENWRIGRSAYLTKITGFKDADEWKASLYKKLKQLNTAECKGCGKSFTRDTLNKYEGFCGRCYKARQKETV